jgi:hypothetical protein
MDLQLFLVFILLALAASYLLVGAYKAWRKLHAGTCNNGCGCGQVEAKKSRGMIAPENLAIRSKRP